MEMKHTEFLIKQGIEVYKLKQSGGLFGSDIYDYKTLYNLDEVVKLTHEGWVIKNQNSFFQNLALFMYRDLKYNNSKNE